ncbi:MAG: hypothetical protein JWO58_3209 [Chitinophagaceae bacterium]|nr:hypothetical protein [Chitinophagaceae bacterium]
MRKIHYRIGMVFMLLPLMWLSWSACKRTLKSNEIVGDSKLVTAPEEFTGIVGAVAPMVYHPYGPSFTIPVISTYKLQLGNGFNADRFYFDNQLSHEVTWFIKFKGTSGAEKQYTGTGNSIDSLHMVWNGSADGYRFFIAGDTVTYTISFLGSSINYTGILYLKNSSSGPINYSTMPRLLSNGNILRYFYIDGMVDGGSGIRTSYTDAGDGNGAGQFFVSTALQVDGHFSYYMKATDNNANTYCGGASGESLTEMYGATSQTDASEVYINAYIYGYGRANTTLTFQCFENDSWNPGDPVPTVRPAAASNDMWYGMVQVDWVGWKLVSIPYSSFKSANNPNSGGGGNRIREPHKLAGFGIELDSYPNGGSTVELSLDAVYLTTNGPFQP